MAKQKIAVIGAGVIGLVQAVVLAEQGYAVTVFSKDSPLTTTTLAAGAIWMPYKAFPLDKVLVWAGDSLQYYKALSTCVNTGVIMSTHHAFYDEPTPRPAWLDLLMPGEAPNFFVPNGVAERHSVELPVIDPYQFVSYLLALLTQLKVAIVTREITDLAQLPEYPIIINAAGMGAKTLARDTTVFAIKGQTFTLTQPKQKINQSLFYEQGDLMTLIVPHEQHVTIGVTVVEHDDSVEYDYVMEERLHQSALAFHPELAHSTIIDRRVGHRPASSNGIRLNSEYLKSSNQWLFHSYGHAGGGLTLAPGCAHDILKRIENISIEKS